MSIGAVIHYPIQNINLLFVCHKLNCITDPNRRRCENLQFVNCNKHIGK